MVTLSAMLWLLATGGTAAGLMPVPVPVPVLGVACWVLAMGSCCLVAVGGVGALRLVGALLNAVAKAANGAQGYAVGL